MNPDTPVIRGTAQNPDIYFQTREAVNQFYEALPEVVDGYMKEISKLTGRDYQLSTTPVRLMPNGSSSSWEAVPRRLRK